MEHFNLPGELTLNRLSIFKLFQNPDQYYVGGFLE